MEYIISMQRCLKGSITVKSTMRSRTNTEYFTEMARDRVENGHILLNYDY